MSRVRRLRLSDRIFFVTVDLQPTLDRFEYDEFPLILDAVHSSRQRLRFLLYGYVLMPDHWHALLFCPQPLTISRAVQDIKYTSARRLNRHRRRSGRLWQHQFWDRFVRHPQEFRERLDYMHLNPVRRELVQEPGDWRWSSFNNFDPEKRADCPIQIDYVLLPDTYRA